MAQNDHNIEVFIIAGKNINFYIFISTILALICEKVVFSPIFAHNSDENTDIIPKFLSDLGITFVHAHNKFKKNSSRNVDCTAMTRNLYGGGGGATAMNT